MEVELLVNEVEDELVYEVDIISVLFLFFFVSILVMFRFFFLYL